MYMYMPSLSHSLQNAPSLDALATISRFGLNVIASVINNETRPSRCLLNLIIGLA